jgi:hypothetical protein
MPFELGLFMGMAHTAPAKRPRSSVLILDREVHRYDKFISDISGQDISSHENTVEGLIQAVRHWLNKQYPRSTIIGSLRLQQLFTQFDTESKARLLAEGKSEVDLCFNDWTTVIALWLMSLPQRGAPPCPHCGK